MNRLTKKIEKDFYCTSHYIITNNDVIYKLGKLEDAEEELGVELTTLFKALRDGVFINEDGIIYKDYIKSIEYCSECWFFITKEEEIEIFFEDYGVTWALTFEELEKEEDE